MTSKERRVRIGIDVGGTFTHAVALDAATLEIIVTKKVPTTHTDITGVAAGIVESLFELMKEGEIRGEEIVMIAHSTTQATNALLEGDVAPVGIIGMAGGFGKGRAKSQTRIGDMELAPGRFLKTYHRFIDVSRGLTNEQIELAVQELQAEGAEVIVGSCAFSVEDAVYENQVADYCKLIGVPVTTGCEISQLYGLKARTRTAVINASMLPKMLETADMTEKSVREAGISSPLMIMRSDGGVMDIDQMRKRPILTMLSGPAAGVAAAMMYARISDGIFLEVGGTSTDISAIRNGKSLVKSAVIGGNRLYLRTLDVRTLGVAGGSVPRISGGTIVDVGPRSAHIANVHYAVFDDDLKDKKIIVEKFCPKEGDPADYVRMKCDGHGDFSVTPSCASNVLGLVEKEQSSAGSLESAETAFRALAEFMGHKDYKAVADEMMERGTRSVVQTVEDMIEDYELEPQLLTLTGGGGGAAAIVPYTAKRMGIPFVIAENAAVISAIGAALALVRDMIEKTVMNPTEVDVLKIRKEAEEAVVRMGADPKSVEVQIEIDSQKSILRATATGTTELRTKELGTAEATEKELETIVRRSVRGNVDSLTCLGRYGNAYIYQINSSEKLFGKLLTRRFEQYRVVDSEGIIRLQLKRGRSLTTTKHGLQNGMKEFFEANTVYGDAGKEHPDVYVIFRGKISDMSGLVNIDQILSLLQIELSSVGDDEPVAVLIRK